METKQRAKETDLEQETLTVELSVTTIKSEKFIDELEKICKKYSIEKDYFFKFQ